ncbi:ABC transporter permease [Frateuria hangzhouensis]|uniref:ABC transporter permease n=1 Tax=Frateuria hangzhouensis TaxID=2995589 RepID=UPI0022608CCA|nr:ABC transporter permease [Frateuria sp. STR12]MCX7513665.1 ABC transporter permease [Frateuria sp. STR12]
MFAYYLDLALRSLRRNPVLTGLMVLAIGLGIGASMTMLTVLHVMAQDPLPQRSAQLYYPHIDPLPKAYPAHNDWGDPSDNFTWPDAMALLERAGRGAAMAGGNVLVWPVDPDQMPFRLQGHYTTAGFFGLFGLSFEQGHGWSPADDEAHARVVVLSHELAHKLFGEADAVGRMVRLDDSEFQVIGVTADWAPQPMFYADASSKGGFGEADRFFLPLSTAVDLDMGVSGNQASWKEGENGKRSPGLTWLQVWVELKDAAQVRAYRQFLVDYSAQQQRLGRFERPAQNARLYSLMGWLQHEELVPGDVRLQLWLALGFLTVCLTNIIALLLAKFLRRSAEVSVRRALGARRRDIFLQFGIESALIGTLGGALGIAIAQAGLWSVRHRPDAYAAVARMDLSMLALTVVLAVLGSVLAGLLPAWRASRVAPALQLKAL